MRKIGFLSTLLFILSAGITSSAQDFSNKGKDFWVAYGYHQGMVGAGNSQNMVLYFAAEQDANVTVSIPGLGYTQTYFVAANTVVTSNAIPKAGAQDARLLAESVIPEKKGIHITSDRPVIAYAHIYNQSVSGATILFPTITLGKEYYSVNYTNNSNSQNANCWFYVIAADTGTTTVEITPSANTINHPANTTFSITLQQGEVYNVMGQYNTNTGVDLTGSVIRSVSTASGGCKRIAVFSGSGRINITCNGPSASASSDNYMSQAFPKTAWGKKYLTAPATGAIPANVYRVCVQDPSTVVKINGVVTGLALQGNFYYEIPATAVPQLIEADKPIMVAQYFTSANQCGNNTPNGLGDPEVIYLSPVEQNINKVLWNATRNFQILQQFFNVVIPNGGTAISSFRLDGAPVPASSFIIHPGDPNYSYLQYQLTGGPFGDGSGQHIIQSDSGFNAIAYGFGVAESYGYNAGTNIKDIYQYISVNNQYATVNFPAACKGAPFSLSMTFPYQPTQIVWHFNGVFPDVTIDNPVYTSSTVVNGKTLYKYDLPGTYTLSTGTYPISIIAQNPTADGCSGVQEISYDLQVFDLPTADFNFATNGCVSSAVTFTGTPVGNGRPITHWYWNFGDGNALNDIVSTTHTYAAPGSYNVKYTVITDVGCKSDTTYHTVVLNDPPVANFTATGPYCAGRSVTFTDNSTVATGSITKWHWNFGDGGPTTIVLSNAPQTHVYAATGPYTVTLQVETAAGCLSNVFSTVINVKPVPVVSFTLPNVCLPAGTAQFNSTSTISDGSQNQFIYLWNFGDASPNAGGQNPVHNYTAVGPFDVKLIVTSNSGCIDSLTRSLTTIYAEPQAAFNAPAEVCPGTAVNFTDQSTAPGSTVTQWQWNFGDGNTSNSQNPSNTYNTPGTYTVTLSVTSAIGCQTTTATHIATHTVVVDPQPRANFTVSAPDCAGRAVTFTDISDVASGTITKWHWNFGDGPTIIVLNNAPQTHVYSTPGSYQVSLQVETAIGCLSGVAATQVDIKPVPVVNFALPNVCLPAGTAQFNSTSTISDGTQNQFTYLWNFGDGTPTATGQSPVHNFASAGPFDVKLIVTSNSGCIDSLTRSLTTIYAEPQAIFNGPAEVCAGSIANFIDQSAAPGSTVTQWQWNFGDGNTSNVQNPSNTYAAPGNYTVTLSVTSAIGCATVTNTHIATRTVIVNPLPTANFNISTPDCAGQGVTFTDVSAANAGNIIKWTWNYGDATNAVLATGVPFVHTYTTSGSYPATLQVETNKGCISTLFPKTVVVNQVPDAGFVAPIVCVNDVLAPFTDTSHIPTGSITAWNWNFGDPNANAGNPNTSAVQNPTHHYTQPGSYTAQLIATSNAGCKDTTTRTVTVNGGLLTPSFTLQNTSALCSNEQIVIKDASSINAGNIVRVEIFWDPADNTIKTTDNAPVAGATYTHVYPEFGSPATKAYTINYVVYSGLTCFNSVSQPITLLATPQLAFSAVLPVCSNQPSFQLTEAQIQNGLPGSGTFSGTGVSSTGLFNPSIAAVGSNVVTYTYTANNGCANSVDQTVIVNPTPVADAGPDKVVLEGGYVVLTPQLVTNIPVTYTWSPAIGLNNPSIPNVQASPATDFTYTLTVTSDKGCTNSDQVFVKLLKSPVIPNIFSPNGDGIHDTWVIDYLDSYPGCVVQIFNRYGQMVQRFVNYTTPWDGKINGKDAPIGTYYYIIDPKNGRKPITGFVDIIR